jgi:hypothetical protein
MNFYETKQTLITFINLYKLWLVYTTVIHFLGESNVKKLLMAGSLFK